MLAPEFCLVFAVDFVEILSSGTVRMTYQHRHLWVGIVVLVVADCDEELAVSSGAV